MKNELYNKSSCIVRVQVCHVNRWKDYWLNGGDSIKTNHDCRALLYNGYFMDIRGKYCIDFNGFTCRYDLWPMTITNSLLAIIGRSCEKLFSKLCGLAAWQGKVSK